MNFNQFVELCTEVYGNAENIDGELQLEYFKRGDWRSCDRNREKINTPRLYVSWSPGGVSGGNCWDSTEPTAYSNHEKPKELQILDSILEKICPNISFLQYKSLTNQLIKFEEWTEPEYYGNSTDYCSLMVDVKELYNYLVEHNIIKNE